ncbi:MAG: transposase [Tannerella sp.]|jgi:transposase/uncharacterized protein YkuJ|nr:transposase [Tannerella sp.]
MGIKKWREGERQHLQDFFKKLGGRYKRTRRRPKGQPTAGYYTLQMEKLNELEETSGEGKTDLYYNRDGTRVCSKGYVPYGRQFPDEDVRILSEKAYKLSRFGFINRAGVCRWKTTEGNTDAQFVLEYMEDFSFQASRKTFVVLDKARVHKAKAIQERIPCRHKRGRCIFFLPPCSLHLNIAETVWRKLKKEWLNPEDYLYKENLFYAVNRCMAALENCLRINFSHFNIN